ncbi:MAG: hypothetical protein SGI98_08235 [Verrucomicrobiota bacterium]|nr:hypothetical protein [Verrucomicrobiota bacterium]
MNLIVRLEKRFGKLAIPGIIRYVILVQAAFFVLVMAMPGLQARLILDPAAVLSGELWRLITYVFIPPDSFKGGWVIFILFYFLFFWSIGDSLEAAWGTFKLNLYLLCGMFFMTIVAFFVVRGQVDNVFLMLSLLFAYATVFPDEIIHFFMIIPLKVKWLGIISAAMLLPAILFGSFAQKAAILVSFGNYFLFFWAFYLEIYRNRKVISQQKIRLKEFQKPINDNGQSSFHECMVCHRTDVSNPDLEFRISGSDGEEYCQDHISQAPYKNAGL